MFKKPISTSTIIDKNHNQKGNATESVKAAQSLWFDRWRGNCTSFAIRLA
jgi:hypothetical protein